MCISYVQTRRNNINQTLIDVSCGVHLNHRLSQGLPGELGHRLPLFEPKFHHRYTCGAGSNGGDGNTVAWFSHFSVKMIWVRLGFKKVAYWDLSRYPKCSGLTFFGGTMRTNHCIVRFRYLATEDHLL
jgi:hypothetical protein